MVAIDKFTHVGGEEQHESADKILGRYQPCLASADSFYEYRVDDGRPEEKRSEMRSEPRVQPCSGGQEAYQSSLNEKGQSAKLNKPWSA